MRLLAVTALTGALLILPGALGASAAPPGETYTSTDVPVAVPVGGTATSDLTIVEPAARAILDVNVVGLRLVADETEDIDLFLESPSGTVVELLTDVCGSEEINGAPFTLDDEAATVIGTTCPPASGASYQPEGSLSNFDGEPYQGTWTLSMTDDSGSGGLSLNAWGLRIFDGCTIHVAGPNQTTVGTDGNDVICGTPGPDEIFGGRGGDVILGGDGDDILYGQAGGDFIRGLDGRDYVVGGGGHDRLFGDKANDNIRARDQLQDDVNGGQGLDQCQLDPQDNASNCNP